MTRLLQRRRRLNPVSAKKRAGDAQYRKVREWVKDRANGLCEAQVSGVCEGRGVHAHHLLRRSQGGPDTPGNLLWVCAADHRWIHDHPTEAQARGLLRQLAARCDGRVVYEIEEDTP